MITFDIQSTIPSPALYSAIVMPTATEERVMISLRLPKHLASLIEKESKFSRWPVASLMRHLIKWHAGNAPGRHPEAPAVKRAKKASEKRVLKAVLVDVEDAKHLDSLSAFSGLTRVATLVLIIHAWFELDPIPRKP